MMPGITIITPIKIPFSSFVAGTSLVEGSLVVAGTLLVGVSLVVAGTLLVGVSLDDTKRAFYE